MKSEKPAEGIMKTGDWGNSKCYKIVCGCQQPDHEHDVWVESSDVGVNVDVFVTSKTDYWSETFKKRYDIENIWQQEFDWAWKDLVNGIISRVKLTWSIWTKGYIKTETTITMSEQQAFNYADAIKSAVQDVKDFRKQPDPKNKSASKLAEEGDCV